MSMLLCAVLEGAHHPQAPAVVLVPAHLPFDVNVALCCAVLEVARHPQARAHVAALAALVHLSNKQLQLLSENPIPVAKSPECPQGIRCASDSTGSAWAQIV